MDASALETRAHELLSHLAPGKLAAVVHLLELMVHEGMPMEDVLAEFGMKPDDFPIGK